MIKAARTTRPEVVMVEADAGSVMITFTERLIQTPRSRKIMHVKKNQHQH